MQNRDFLFLYDAALCNPNGDPDKENRPRMDEDTNTNLVSDVRVKRYVRDHWKEQGHEIFVDLVSDNKVSMETRIIGVLTELLNNRDRLNLLLEGHTSEQEALKAIDAIFGTTAEIVDYLMNDKADAAKKKKLPGKKEVQALNAAILAGIVAHQFIDVRCFGSAFAVPGFNKAVTGPIQLGWGYSLNEVFLLDTKTISSIMNDDNSTFGRDFRLKYSLLAFIGTINAAAAKRTGLSDEDLTLFREGLWESIAAGPTRSKINQYPKLYLEVVYAQGKPNGSLGDLRKLISSNPKKGLEPQQVTGIDDLELDFSRLVEVIRLGKESGVIAEVIAKKSFDFTAFPDLDA